MIETLVIALLVWLWVIERRLNGLRDAVQTLTLDVDGLRALSSRADSRAESGTKATSKPAGRPPIRGEKIAAR